MTDQNKDGVQKRIDKLVAEREAIRAENEALKSQLQSKDIMAEAMDIAEKDLPANWEELNPEKQAAIIAAKVSDVATKKAREQTQDVTAQIRKEAEAIAREEVKKLRLESMGFNADQISTLDGIQNDTGVTSLDEALALAKVRQPDLFKGINPGEVPGSHFVQRGLPPTPEGDKREQKIKDIQEKIKTVQRGSVEAKQLGIELIKARL